MSAAELEEPVQACKARQDIPPARHKGTRALTVSRSSPSISASFKPLSTRNLRFAAAFSYATCGEARNVLARCKSSDRSSGAVRAGSAAGAPAALVPCDVELSGDGGGGA